MRLILFIAILMALPFAAALSIDAPSALPQNTSWGFSVNLDSTDSWTRATLKIDDVSLLDVYSNGTIVNDPFNGQFVLKSFAYDSDPKSTSGLVLYVSHFGLSSGSHTILVSADSGSDSKTVVSFSAIDDSYKETIDSRVTELENASATHFAQNNSTANRINETDERILELKDSIADQNRSVKSRFASIEEWLVSLDLNQSRTDSAMLLREQSGQKARLTGFASIASTMAIPVIVGLMIVVAFVGVVFIAIKAKGGFKLKSIYTKDDYGLPISPESEGMADALAQDSGKWASKKL